MRRRLGTGWAAVVAAGVAVVFVSACGSGTPSGVTVGLVTRGDVTETVDAAGNVTPRSQAVLTAPTDAVVADVLVTEGQDVTAGQVLVQLSSASAEQELTTAQQALAKAPEEKPAQGVDLQAFAQQLDASAQAAFASAKAAADQISDPDARHEALEQIDKAQQSFEASSAQADTAVKQAEQGLTNASSALAALGDEQRDQAEAAVAVAQANVAALTIRAPFDGTATLGGPAESSGSSSLSSIESSLSQAGIDVSGLGGSSSTTTTTAEITPGAHVGQGTSIATVVDSTSLGITATVDETDILSVHLGDVAAVSLDAVPDATYPAKVTGIDQLPSGAGGSGSVSYTVEMSLLSGTDSQGHLAPKPRAGMSAVAEITVDHATAAISVPSAAILHDVTDSSNEADIGASYVWLIKSGRALEQDVVLGVQGSDSVEVLQGLSAGESIVVEGASKIKAGEKLKAAHA